eukprot:252856-Rhodomonas_salina.2
MLRCSNTASKPSATISGGGERSRAPSILRTRREGSPKINGHAKWEMSARGRGRDESFGHPRSSRRVRVLAWSRHTLCQPRTPRIRRTT